MLVLVIILDYLLGSIPTAYIAGHITRGGDIRQIGDGNMGAQNAFRQLGPKTGIIVGIIDAIKGALAVLLAYAIGIPLLAILLAGVAAVIGHNWPIFLGFRGGRGECTTIGVFSVLITVPMLISGALAIAIIIKTGNVMRASIVMFVTLPLLCWWFSIPGLLVAYSILLPVIVGITHFMRTKKRMIIPA
ncbi:MAG: glycerol-3-phosphate acyltransferase [Dehalococcoidia bacterium]|nr:MAG: glycerol-3-phosphate acyltransferase [Dehalococcoidia bacterium]